MSIRLSDLVKEIVHDSQTIPDSIKMKKMAYVVGQLPLSSKVLKEQIMKRMKNYVKEIISEREMVNTLVLTDFVVENQPIFRKEVIDLDFIALIEVIGHLKRKIGKLNEVEIKVREIITKWGGKDLKELREYNVLYLKCCKEGIIVLENNDGLSLPKEVLILKRKVDIRIKKIENLLRNQSGEVEKVYRESLKLNTKFIEQISKCDPSIYDSELIKECQFTSKKLSNLTNDISARIFVEDRLQIIIDTSSLPQHPKRKGLFKKLSRETTPIHFKKDKKLHNDDLIIPLTKPIPIKKSVLSQSLNTSLTTTPICFNSSQFDLFNLSSTSSIQSPSIEIPIKEVQSPQLYEFDGFNSLL